MYSRKIETHRLLDRLSGQPMCSQSSVILVVQRQARAFFGEQKDSKRDSSC